MKKDLTMRKSTFVKGAFITTLGIIISKILGILYVIPFHAFIWYLCLFQQQVFH